MSVRNYFSGGAATRKRPTQSRPLERQQAAAHGSIFGGHRSAPAEAVVHADLDGVIVVAEARADDRGRSPCESRAAEIVVLVLGLGRPVRGEHVFKARADGPAILVI